MPVADAAARLRAQTDFSQPLLVEAGAGTGKTAVLVARILAWALGPGWERAQERLSGARGEPATPSDIAGEVLARTVAITFTEAAAAEMSGRVAEALLRIERGEPPDWITPEALPGADAQRTRAAALVGALHLLGTRTIHAFCRRILSEHPLDAGLHPRVEVDADGQHRAAVVRQALEELLPVAFGDPPDPDFDCIADAELGPADLEEAVLRLIEEGARPADLDAAPLTETAVARWCADFEASAQPVCEWLDALPKLSPEPRATRETLEALRICVADRPADPVEAFAALRACFDAQEPESARSKLTKWTRGNFLKGEQASGGDALRERVVACARRLRSRLDLLGRVDPPTIAALRNVVRRLLTTASERLAARGVQSYGGLLRGARDLVCDHPSVATQLRSQMDQLLVDEFQDTDALQCELLDALAFAGDAGERPTLFLVGDPKQSIYGWRNADLAAYDGFKARIAAQGVVERLFVNFRSVPAILEESQRCIEPVMHEQPGLQPRFESLVAGTEAEERAAALAWPAVERWIPQRLDAESGEFGKVVSRDVNELEAAALASDLLRLRDAGEPLGEVAILCRTTTDFEPILAALREAGVPFLAERETEFAERREIVEAVARVRCVLDPNDAIALVATLRSALVGVPDAALLPLWRNQLPTRLATLDGAAPPPADLEACVLAAAAETPRDIPGIEELAAWPEAVLGFAERLHALRHSLATETPERFVERLRLDLCVEVDEAARHLGRHRVAHLDRFHRDLVAALDEAAGSAATVAGWLRRSGGIRREHREGRARALQGDAVQVMTMHRAKGLDFDHVYVLQTQKRRPNLRHKRTQVHRTEAGIAYELCGVPCLAAGDAEAEAERVEQLERVRLLYVALTRARNRLVISGPFAEGKAPEQAQSHAVLLGNRSGTERDTAERLARIAAGGQEGFVDARGVYWRAPFVWAEGSQRGSITEAGQGEGRPGAASPISRAPELRALRAAAAERSARPYTRAASDTHAPAERADVAHGMDGPASEMAPPEFRAAEPDAAADDAREIAMAAGTAVHAALERAASAGDASATFERALAAEPAAIRGPARERAEAVWARFQAGPLAARLEALDAHVVARELPVVLAPGALAAADARDPVGAWTGALDLVYRDPEDGAWVVADYKTDHVTSEAELGARVEAYAAQGAVYTRALQAALELPERPRFELWFVDTGEVVRSPPEA